MFRAAGKAARALAAIFSPFHPKALTWSMIALSLGS
jgi:hypothetical protein